MRLLQFFVFLLLSAALILSIGCRKDNSDKRANSTDTTFLIGISNTFNELKIFIPPLELRAIIPNQKEYLMDIDNDGTPDFALISKHIISSGGLKYGYSAIRPLNNWSEISAIDTLLLTRECVSDLTHSITQYTNFSKYQCSLNNSDISKGSSTSRYPMIYDNQDKLSYSGIWSADEMQLSYYDSTFSYYSPVYYYYRVVRGIWNEQQEKYVGVKLNKDNKTRFGWIKLSIENHKDVKLHEFAIQK
jgi:hypothetical protein